MSTALTRYHAIQQRLLEVVLEGGWDSPAYHALNDQAAALWDGLSAEDQAETEGRLLIGHNLTGEARPFTQADEPQED